MTATPKKAPPGTSYIRFSPHAAFQATGLSPLLVTGILVHELRNHFQPGQIEDPRAQKYVWRPKVNDNTEPSERDTGILIDPWSKPDRRTTGNTPHVMVRRVKVGGGDYKFLNSNAWITNMAGMEVPLAGENHTMVVQGQHHIGVACDEVAAVEVVTWEIFRHLEFFHDAMMREYGFGEFGVVGISEVDAGEAARNGYDVAVIVSYAFNLNWVVAEVAPRMAGSSVVVE